MGIEIAFLIPWMTFWIAVTVSGLRHSENMAQVFGRWWLAASCTIAGPEYRARLARIRARKALLAKVKKKEIAEKAAAYKASLAECDWCQSKVVASTRTSVAYGTMLCIPCHKRIFPTAMPKPRGESAWVKQQHRTAGVITVNEQREQSSSEERVKKAFSDAAGKDVMVLGEGASYTPVYATDSLKPVNYAPVAYFKPAPEIAKRWNIFGQYLTEAEVRLHRHEVWARMDAICSKLEGGSSLTKAESEEWDYCEKMLRQLDTILDRMVDSPHGN